MKIVKTKYITDIYPFIGPDDNHAMKGRISVYVDPHGDRHGAIEVSIASGLIDRELAERYIAGLQGAIKVSDEIRAELPPL